MKKLMLDYKVSTITVSMRIPNCELHLINIGKYLEIDENILGIKYTYNSNLTIIKGKYSTSIYKKSKNKNQNKINKRLFYNQVSLILKIPKESSFPENIIHVKIFGNGSLHLTGIKEEIIGQSLHECKMCIIIINKLLLGLLNKNVNILLTKDENEIFLDNNNNIYTVGFGSLAESSKTSKLYEGTSKFNIIGYKMTESTGTLFANANSVKGNLYIINKKEYIVKNNIFIANKMEGKRTKSILDLNGNYIGFSKINLIKNKNKLYKNNSNIYCNDEFIFYETDNKSTIIGNISYTINNFQGTNYIKKNFLQPNKSDEKNVLEVSYNCNPFKNSYSAFDLENFSDEQFILNYDFNINNINIFLNLNIELNREKLFKELFLKKYIVEYTPDKYSGVKLTFKVHNLQNTLDDNIFKTVSRQGLCICNNKCTCKNITFLIFQSGNIIATGFKSIKDINLILNHFEYLMNEIKPNIIKKIF